MQPKLILVEGIPGSGKTTIAKKISAYYRDRGVSATTYSEGEAHPADLGWIACVPSERYNDLLERYPQFAEDIKANSQIEHGYAMIAYLRIRDRTKAFHDEMESYEVYDRRAEWEVFRDLHLYRWHAFAESHATKDEIAVFECALLQNHINEALFFYSKSTAEITAHLKLLVDSVVKLNPTLIYLAQPDVRETIRRVSDARADKHGRRDWMERVIGFFESCPHGGYNGFDGMVQAFEDRRLVEMAALPLLGIPVHIVGNPVYNWENVWHGVLSVLPNGWQVGNR
jgi:hypothetical protein